MELEAGKKFCQHCGEQIDKDCVICPKCGKQVAEIQSTAANTPNIVINNTNTNVNNAQAMYMRKPKNKWIALLLLFTVIGHKIYEGKILMAVVYFFTAGFFGLGLIIDFFVLLFKPNPYYV